MVRGGGKSCAENCMYMYGSMFMYVLIDSVSVLAAGSLSFISAGVWRIKLLADMKMQELL